MTEKRLAETAAKSTGSVRPELANLIKLVDDFIREEKEKAVIKESGANL
jgi:hypothetical protein